MHPLLALCCLLVLVSPRVLAERPPFTARDLVALDRVSDPQVSPDAERVAYVLRTIDLEQNQGQRSIWLLDVDSGQGRRLTSGKGHSDTPRWAPNGDLYFLSTRSGSRQVWRLPAGGGEAESVTDLPLDVNHFVLAPSGDRIALAIEGFRDCAADLACTRTRLDEQSRSKAGGVLYNRLFVRHWDRWKDGTRSKLFVAPLSAGKAGKPVLVSGDLDGDAPSKPHGDDSEIRFTPDGKQLVFAIRVAGREEAWNTNLDLWRAPCDGSEPPENLTIGNPAMDTSPRITPDGKTMVWLAASQPGFEADRRHIRVMDLKTGTSREVAASWDRSPNHIELSEDGRTLYASADDLGQSPLFAINLASGIVRKLTEPGTVAGFSVSDEGVVYAHSRLDAPDDLYLLRWNGRERRLTTHNAARLAGLSMQPYEQFSFRGWNDETVYGYVVKPAGFSNYVSSKKFPVALIIHGGPQHSMANDFHYRWNAQAFAGMGYAVVFIDFHGSTGYGQAFTNSISGDWGGKPLEDLQKGWAHALATYSWLDGSRACALGASYGGWMVNWINGTWPDAFRCLVNHGGVFDNRSLSYSTDELWFDEWERGSTQYDHPENFERQNPVNHVAQWRTPMLVTHGAQDFRVPLEQGLATFTALQRRDIESQFLHFPDESHWILRPQNSLLWYETVKEWMDRWLSR